MFSLNVFETFYFEIINDKNSREGSWVLFPQPPCGGVSQDCRGTRGPCGLTPCHRVHAVMGRVRTRLCALCHTCGFVQRVPCSLTSAKCTGPESLQDIEVLT